ncbi:MAG TPA: Ger(x)C family spore germination protein [Bacillales bacterium]|nr:Ger(x)C family spore germination protein [Bacillales bacterium]
MDKINKGPLVFLISLALLLPGCWNQTEIDHLAIITAAGLDLTKDHDIHLSVEVVIPKNVLLGSSGSSGGSGSGQPRLVRSASGQTLNDAITHLQRKVPRELFWGQMKVVVIGKALAQKGIREQMDYFSRQSEARLDIYPFVSSGKAIDILSMGPKLENNVATLLQNEFNQRMSQKSTINEVLQTLAGEGKDTMMPLVEPNSKEKIPYISGKAIFSEGKLKGVSKGDVFKGIIWISNEIQPASLKVRIPGKKGGYVSMDLIRTNSYVVPKIQNGKWTTTIHIESADDLVQNATKLDVSQPKVIHQIEKAGEKKVRLFAHKALQKIQKKWKADTFGFGEAFHKKYPKQWRAHKKEWKKIYPNMKVKLDVHLIVKRSGLNNGPAGLPKGRVKEK